MASARSVVPAVFEKLHQSGWFIMGNLNLLQRCGSEKRNKSLEASRDGTGD